MSRPLPSLQEAKAQAKALRQSCAAAGETLSHSAALERVAKDLGFRDWNTCVAGLGRAGPRGLRQGDRVSGRYLGQAFTGEVIRAESVAAKPGWTRLELHLDQAVDVVRFAAFSNLRRRIRGTVGPQGFSEERTSDGVPHLEITSDAT